MIRLIIVVLVFASLSCSWKTYTRDNSIYLSENSYYYYEKVFVDDLPGDTVDDVVIVNQSSSHYYAQCVQYALLDLFAYNPEAWSYIVKVKLKKVVIVNSVGVLGYADSSKRDRIYITPYNKSIEQYKRTILHEVGHLYIWTSEGYKDFKWKSKIHGIDDEGYCRYLADSLLKLQKN